MITRLAATKFIPKPPARVEIRKSLCIQKWTKKIHLKLEVKTNMLDLVARQLATNLARGFSLLLKLLQLVLRVSILVEPSNRK